MAKERMKLLTEEMSWKKESSCSRNRCIESLIRNILQRVTVAVRISKLDLARIGDGAPLALGHTAAESIDAADASVLHSCLANALPLCSAPPTGQSLGEPGSYILMATS